jgi:hypothetical protein
MVLCIETYPVLSYVTERACHLICRLIWYGRMFFRQFVLDNIF